MSASWRQNSDHWQSFPLSPTGVVALSLPFLLGMDVIPKGRASWTFCSNREYLKFGRSCSSSCSDLFLYILRDSQRDRPPFSVFLPINTHFSPSQSLLDISPKGPLPLDLLVFLVSSHFHLPSRDYSPSVCQRFFPIS